MEDMMVHRVVANPGDILVLPYIATDENQTFEMASAVENIDAYGIVLNLRSVIINIYLKTNI